MEERTEQEVRQVTEQEKAELAQLREEKQRAEMERFAGENLKKYGIDSGFSPYLVGKSQEETVVLIQKFARHFDSIMTEKNADHAPAADKIQETPKRARGVRVL